MGLPEFVVTGCPLAVLASTPMLIAPEPCLSGAPPPLGAMPLCNCSHVSGLILIHLILGPDFAISLTLNP